SIVAAPSVVRNSKKKKHVIFFVLVCFCMKPPLRRPTKKTGAFSTPATLARPRPLRTADLADRAAQAGDELPATDEMGFLGGENPREPPLPERQPVDPIRFGIDPRRVAYAVDEPARRVQAAAKIIVFAVGAPPNCGGMTVP